LLGCAKHRRRELPVEAADTHENAADRDSLSRLYAARKGATP